VKELTAVGHVRTVGKEVEAVVVRLDHKDVSAVKLDPAKMYEGVKVNDLFIVVGDEISKIRIFRHDFTEMEFASLTLKIIDGEVKCELKEMKKNESHGSNSTSVQGEILNPDS
jgi:hypothetical protein